MIDYAAVNEITRREAAKPRDNIDSLIRYVRGRRIFQSPESIAKDLVGQYPNDLVFFAIKGAELLAK